MSRVFLPAVLVTCVFSRIPFWKRLIAPLSFRPYEPDNPTFDPLTATVFELQELLSSKKINSVDLVSRYITQIKLHDEYLKAVLCVAPTAIEEAHRLDRERLDGRIRGPLHGIPILVKDNIATHPSLGMNTTAGSYALASSRPRENADIVKRLLDAGAIILGKSHLSELSGYKGNDLPPGWSALGGQTQSAYTTGDVDRSDLSFGHSSPGGSSTGSAVGVSAGFAPLAVGTDTIGSIITPSTRAALYGMRTTSGIIDSKGVVPISRRFDVLGPLAKHPRDVAIFLDAVVDPLQTRLPEGGYVTALDGSWDNLRVGFLDPEEWFIPDSLARPNPEAREQMVREIEEAYKNIDGKAKRFLRVSLIPWEEVIPSDGFGLYDLLGADFRVDFEHYLQHLERTQVRSISDVVEYNYEHAEHALPKGYESQEILINALEDHMTDSQYAKTLERIRSISRNQGIDLTLDNNDIDVIIGPADSAFSMLATSAGYPTATLPLSYLKYNGRPFGLFVMAKAHQEDLLLKVMSCWETSFPKRKPPVLPASEKSRL